MTAAHNPSAESRNLLIVLAGLVALGPLSIDMYLPAMPTMSAALDTGSTEVQLTISSYLLGFSLFHLLCGPLADRYGRRPILLLGLLLYLAATVACTLANSIEQLIVFRLLQGIGACVGPTLGRAMARDIYGPRRAARALAHIAMIMALAPAIAPALGGLLLEWLGWNAIFATLALYALLLTVVVSLRLPETVPQRQPFHPAVIGRNYLELLACGPYMRVTLASAALYVGMVSYLSASSFVFIEMMNVPVRYFGLLFLTTVAGYIAGNALSTRLAHGRESEQVIWIGVRLGLIAAAAQLLATEVWFHPASILIPMGLHSLSMGLALPHAMTCALRPYAHMAATASALFGFIQMGLSSLGAATVGIFLVATPRPLVIVVLISSACAWMLCRRLRRA